MAAVKSSIPSTSGMSLRSRNTLHPKSCVHPGEQSSHRRVCEHHSSRGQKTSREISRGHAPSRPSSRTITGQHMYIREEESDEDEEETESEASVFVNHRSHVKNQNNQRPAESGMQTDEMHILRETGRPSSAMSQTSYKLDDTIHGPPQDSLQCQFSTSHNFFCPRFRSKRILLFVLAFLLFPAVQHFLWSVHWALTDRKLRALNSCLITGAFVVNMFLLKKLASTTDFFNITNENMVTEGFTDQIPSMEE